VAAIEDREAHAHSSRSRPQEPQVRVVLPSGLPDGGAHHKGIEDSLFVSNHLQ
jgi:hypothetical protein